MAEETDVLRFAIDIDGKRAQAQVASVQKKFKAEMARMSKSTTGLNILTEKLLHVSKRFGTDYAKSLKLSYKQVDALNAHVRDLNREIVRQTRLMEGASDAEHEAIQKNIKGYEQEISALEEISKLQKTANLGKVFEDATREMGEDLREEVESAFKSIVKYKWSDAGEEISDGFTDSLSSISSRDMGGMAKGFMKSLGAGFKGLGASATRFAAKKKEDPAAGALGKSLGAAVGKMGPLLETVAKLGPILSVASGAIMAIVKLFLDADAAAKDFNKELLSSASTSELLAKSSGSTRSAMGDLEDTMKQIRDSAVSLDNLNWGINKKDHLAVLNVMNSEGVSLDRMKNEAKAAGKAVGAFSADMVHVSVAFSRNFGVSLSEISSFQAEMMTELGASAQTVTKQYASMATGAAESGIASNKFFNIIKGVSSDLSLYNMRMEDAVHMLTLLGKVMSPRNAQKFLQTSMQGFKTMGRAEKLRMTLLAGQGATKEIVERDLNRKTKSLAEKINDAMGGKGNVEEISKAIAAGGAEMKGVLDQVEPSMRGEFADAAKQLQIDQKRSKRGLFGLSTATGNLGAGGVFEMYKKSIGRFGGKSLEESAGSLGGEMMADNLGVSQDQLDQAIKFEQALEDQKDILKQGLKDPRKSAEIERKLLKAGIKAEDIDKAGTDQLLDTMDEGDKKLLTEAGKQVDYAKRQSDLTQSVNDRIETIMDWLLNQFYNVMMDIYDTLLDLVPWSTNKDEKRADLEFQRKVQKSGNKDLIAAMTEGEKASQKPGDLAWRTKDAMVGGEGWKKVASALEAKPTSPEDAKGKIGLARDLLKASSSAQVEKAAGMTGNQDTMDKLNKYMYGGAKEYQKVMDTARSYSDQGMAPDRVEAYKQSQKKTKTLDPKALVDAGLTPAEILQLAAKLGWASDAPEIAKLVSVAATHTADIAGATAAASTATPQPGSGPVGATPPGGPSVAAATAPTPTAASSKDTPPTAKHAEAQLEVATDTHSEAVAARKFAKGSGSNSLKGKVEEGTLEAVRTALFEYYLYSDLDRSSVAAQMKAGKSTKDIVGAVGDYYKGKGATGSSKELSAQFATAPANAAGGTVLKPAPGEVLASVAPGETIVPKGAGGGSGTVVQNFNGPPSAEFEAYIKSGTTKLIAEYERRKKFQ